MVEDHNINRIIESFEKERREQAPEVETGKVSEREILAEIIKKEIEQAVHKEIKPIAPAVAPAPAEIPQKVQPYIQLALNQGITSAVESILQTHSAYLIDAFHDALVDKYFEQLIALGKIKIK